MSRHKVRISRAKLAAFADEAATLPDRGPIGQDGFPIDTEAARRLFAELCRVGNGANEHFATQVRKIEACLTSGTLDLDALMVGGGEDRTIEQAAAEAGLDEQVLSFLVTSSVKPSIELARDELMSGFQPETWRKVNCPACGSLPTLSLLKGEPVLRFSLCSQCGFQWPVDRLSCSICGDNYKEARSYFHGEGQEAYRIDVCDSCHYYIKTIDVTQIDAPDPCLEDLATLHLDVIAVEKGYSRALPNVWSE